MSRAAQAVAQAVKDLRKASQQRSRRVTVDDDVDDGLDGVDVYDGEEPPTSNVEDTTGPTTADDSQPEADMTKTTGRKKRAAKPAKAAKPARVKKAKVDKPTSAMRRVQKATSKTIKLEDMRLAPNGITACSDNMYLQFEFVDGSTVRLKPVNLDPDETFAMRDLLVEWFKKRFAK